MIYHYCIKNNQNDYSCGVIDVDKEISNKDVAIEFTKLIYKNLEKIQGNRYTMENSVIISLTKL